MRPRSRPIDWGLIYRAAEQRLHMRKWEIARYTLSQLLCALASPDESDPHAGNLPITAIGDVEEHWRGVVAAAHGDDEQES